MNRVQHTGNLIVDAALTSWGFILSWLQWMDLQSLNQGVGMAVGVLTAVLLMYRIYLAHEEATEQEDSS
jgi:hypothetical protein